MNVGRFVAAVAERWRGTVSLPGRVFAGALLVTLLGGCMPGFARARSEREMITRQDMMQTHYTNAYDVVAALHGNWLISLPQTFNANGEEPTVLVYFDNVRLGTVDELRYITLEPVQYIRHYGPLEATERWGVGHTEGVIYVSTHAP